MLSSFNSSVKYFPTECHAILYLCKSLDFQNHFQFKRSNEPLYIYQKKSHMDCDIKQDSISNRIIIISDVDMKTKDQIDIVLQHSIENLTEIVLLHKSSNFTARVVLKKGKRGFEIYKKYYGVF